MRLSPAQRRYALSTATAIVQRCRPNPGAASAFAVSAVVMGRYWRNEGRHALLYDLILGFVRDMTGYDGVYPVFDGKLK